MTVLRSPLRSPLRFVANPVFGGIASPVNTVLPAISGTAMEGETLSTTDGTWTGSPTGYTYQWKDDGVAISGATASTYELTAAEVGGVITVTVTATNAGGSTSATTSGTAAVAVRPPLEDLTPTAAWSFSRDLVSTFAGSPRYTDITTAITDWHDQTGNARDLNDLDNATLRPTLTTAGPQSRSCADLNSDGLFSSPLALSEFITNSTGYVVVVGMLDAYTGSAVTLENSPAFFMDTNKVMGVFAQISIGSVGAMNNDGSFDTRTVVNTAGNTVLIMEWRHEGGNLYFRLTKGQVTGSWTAALASGNTSLMNGTVRLGIGASNNYLDGKLFEAMTFNTVPDDTTRNALIADIIAWYC